MGARVDPAVADIAGRARPAVAAIVMRQVEVVLAAVAPAAAPAVAAIQNRPVPPAGAPGTDTEVLVTLTRVPGTSGVSRS